MRTRLVDWAAVMFAWAAPSAVDISRIWVCMDAMSDVICAMFTVWPPCIMRLRHAKVTLPRGASIYNNEEEAVHGVRSVAVGRSIGGRPVNTRTCVRAERTDTRLQWALRPECAHRSYATILGGLVPVVSGDHSHMLTWRLGASLGGRSSPVQL